MDTKQDKQLTPQQGNLEMINHLCKKLVNDNNQSDKLRKSAQNFIDAYTKQYGAEVSCGHKAR